MGQIGVQSGPCHRPIIGRCYQRASDRSILWKSAGEYSNNPESLTSLSWWAVAHTKLIPWQSRNRSAIPRIIYHISHRMSAPSVAIGAIEVFIQLPSSQPFSNQVSNHWPSSTTLKFWNTHSSDCRSWIVVGNGIPMATPTFSGSCKMVGQPDYGEYSVTSGWLVNQTWPPLTGSTYAISYISVYT